MTIVTVRSAKMIASFKHRGLKRLYERGDTSKIAPEHLQKVIDIITVMDAAQTIDDLNLPTFHLHQLAGDRAGVWSVTVRANWRITFLFEDSQADDVNYEDYH